MFLNNYKKYESNQYSSSNTNKYKIFVDRPILHEWIKERMNTVVLLDNIKSRIHLNIIQSDNVRVFKDVFIIKV